MHVCLLEIEEELLANNLDQRYGTEYAIEQVAQDTSNTSRRTQLADQAGYSLSPQNFRNAIEASASGLARSPATLANAINAYTSHEKIPKQIVLGIPGHFILADTGSQSALV